MMYLPRICNYCLNPACVGSCPSGANYKREEDGVVLIDQDRCRGWRYCVSGCPYKKTYYNWRAGKSEKCILCFPRIETGQPPMCFQACVGRIRYLGPILYDIDRMAETANAPEGELVRKHREIILDPFDPEVIAEARKQGISDNWMEACRRSPVYFMVKRWEIALPLHPEFRTLPSLFHIPPESPVKTSHVDRGRNTMDMVDGGTVLPDLSEFRIPIAYLARLLAAGNTTQVETSLLRLLAVREFRRLERVEGRTDASVLAKVGLSVEDARHMHRLLALAHLNASPAARDVGENTQTLELAPPCPLYFGAYMYEEPSSCRGAGASGRNTFMIELAAIYAHFGFDLDDRELPGFIPVAVEFLAVSLDYPERDGIGLRRRLVEKYVQPVTAPLRKALKKYESAYDLPIEARDLAVAEDLERMADEPVWLPPEISETIPKRADLSPTSGHAMEQGAGQ